MRKKVHFLLRTLAKSRFFKPSFLWSALSTTQKLLKSAYFSSWPFSFVRKRFLYCDTHFPTLANGRLVTEWIKNRLHRKILFQFEKTSVMIVVLALYWKNWTINFILSERQLKGKSGYNINYRLPRKAYWAICNFINFIVSNLYFDYPRFLRRRVHFFPCFQSAQNLNNIKSLFYEKKTWFNGRFFRMKKKVYVWFSFFIL